MSTEFPSPDEFPGDMNPHQEGGDYNDQNSDADGFLNAARPGDGFPDSEILPTDDRLGAAEHISHQADLNVAPGSHDLPDVNDLPAEAGLNVSASDAAELPSPVREPLHEHSLDHNRFVGDIHPEGLGEQYAALIETRRANTEYPGEPNFAVQPETIAISQITAGYTASEVGAPMVQQRISRLHLRDFHTFRDESGYTEAVIAETGETPHHPVTFLPESGILIVAGNRLENISRATAGIAMATAVQWVTPRTERDNDGSTILEFDVTQGYDRPDIPHSGGGLNAMVVDMFTDRTLREANIDKADIQRFSGPMAALGSAVVLHTAQEVGEAPQYIEDMLTNGYFTGNPHMLRVMQEVLGDDHMQVLLSLNGTEDYDAAVEAAQTLGLGHARGYIEDAAAGRRMNVYEWR